MILCATPCKFFIVCYTKGHREDTENHRVNIKKEYM